VVVGPVVGGVVGAVVAWLVFSVSIEGAASVVVVVDVVAGVTPDG
jgi:hypothetical protein